MRSTIYDVLGREEVKALLYLITSYKFYFTESVRGMKAESNTPNTGGDHPDKVIDLDIFGAWFGTKNGHVNVKTLTVELTAEFEIVMIYIVAKKMRRVEIKLGELKKSRAVLISFFPSNSSFY